MRYTIIENTNILGKFNTGNIVTIALYKISDGSVVNLTSNVCSEIGTAAIFKWNSSNIITTPTEFTEYLWVMDNSTYKQYGKIVLGGFPDQIKTETDKIQSGIIDDKDSYKADISSLATEANATINKNSIITEVNDNKILIKRVLGLVQENFRIKNPVYDINNNLTSASINIYPTKIDCDNDTNILANYTISATYDANNNIVTYKVTKD